MNIETNSDVNIKEESSENENGLYENCKSNGFLYVDTNDYTENNFDGLEIKEEEEQVEDITNDKHRIEPGDLYIEENLPLNSLKNLANHSQNEENIVVVSDKKIVKHKERTPDNIFQKENRSHVSCESEENLESKRYTLRTRTWSQKLDLDLVENIRPKRKTLKSSIKKKMPVSSISEEPFLGYNGKENFKCLNCKVIFNSTNLFKTHLKNCNITTSENCKSDYENLKNLSSHYIPDSEEIIFYKCDKCNKSFRKKNSLTSHIINSKCSFKKYTCALCNETFMKKINLTKHITAHINSQLNCGNFHMNCNTNSQINVSDNQYSEVSCPTFNCHFCEKSYKGVVAYKKHLKSHSENKSYSSTNSYSNTTLVESKKKCRYNCDTCGKTFLKLVKLKIHILNIHQGINYQCSKCNVKFPSSEDLDAHKAKQDCSPNDLCTCKTCGKMFAKKDYLKKHQYMHMNVLFKCKYCYCAFMKEKSYKKHMEKMNCSKSARKIRMMEFNYKKCRLCDIEFDNEELLIEHFKTSHNGLEPHQCFCCDSCLPTFLDLQNHIHQHNIQKYTCNLCGKPYTSQEGFRKHRLKHKGAEFKCRFCESEFLNENRFKFHEKTCKKNPESGYKPCEKKGKTKKLDKPKQSRQLHWESRIIMKRLRGDPKLPLGEQKNGQDGSLASTFFDESETESTNERGWFDNYYKTEEDDIAFGLKKADESAPPDCDSDLDVDFLQNVSKKKKTSPPPLEPVKPTDECDTDPGLDNYSDNSSEVSSSESDEEVEDTTLPIDYNPKKCRLCVISFGQEYELLHHFIKCHPGEFAHKCPQCGVQSPLYAQLKEHMKTHGIGIGIYNCDNCSKQFKSEKKMKSHNIRCKGIDRDLAAAEKNSISQSGDDSCKRCGKKFYSKFGYRRHKQLCKKKRSKNQKIVAKESDNLIESNDFQLSDQEEVVKTAETVSTEKLTKTTESPNPPGEEKKKEIKDSYTGDPPIDSFPCRLCDKKFQYERGIVMHFKSAHPGNKPLICHVCNMHLADKLKEHLKTHGIGEEFICELCGKRFNQKFLSKIHEMWHQGIEYKCNNCKQKFLNKEKMDKHIGENRCSNRQSLMRLPCDICGKSYRSKFGLSKHYITHTPKELRPVKNRMNCEYCGKWFENNNGLQRHRRIHTGERPFCCRFCPKAFAQEGNCKAHERIHTGESKPRKKKISAVPATSQVFPSNTLNLLPPTAPSAHLSTVDSVSFAGHINLYNYSNIDPNGIVH